jgi:ribosomal protein L11 methyltransferase
MPAIPSFAVSDARASAIAYRIVVPASREDDTVALLFELGTLGIETRADAGDAVLLAYFDDDSGLALRLAEAFERVPHRELTRVPVPAVDWIARFREGFRPFSAAGFTIAPAWAVPAAPEQPLLIVDPGRAFGTGTHESTRLCLALIAELARRGPLGRAADIGAGSGILAIAALRCGASSAVASDLDPEAARACLAHAALNAVPLSVVITDCGQALARRSSDLLLANLTTPLLVAKAAELAALLRPGGRAVLAGLLADDLPVVRAAWAATGLVSERRENDWAALLVETVSA